MNQDFLMVDHPGYGFSARANDFAEWRELIGFLNEQLRQFREARGEQIVRDGLGGQMLPYAPRNVLDRFLAPESPI